ncbi:hypothetical protein PG991_008698 [Apiospora marii]|uniref:Uncharacterized protein n=1 Tax=Apiospora marii TaxID=335849 RepID=A0ABR1RLJ0_9PEZI
MSPTVIRYSTLALVLCLPLSTANGGHSYSGNLDFKRMGWDAAFGDPDIVHNDWIRAGYWVRIAAANVPSPEHGANVSSATAMSLRPLTDDDDYSYSLSNTSRHGLGYTTHEMSIDDKQKPLGPNQPSQEDIQPSWDPDDDIKDICVTVYHLGKEAQARARYDPGDCRSFLSDDCIGAMMSEARAICGDLNESREPLVRTSACMRWTYVEFTVEYDAFWAYRGDAHDPADESALVAAQEAVVPVVWHTTRYMPGGDGAGGHGHGHGGVDAYRDGAGEARRWGGGFGFGFGGGLVPLKNDALVVVYYH